MVKASVGNRQFQFLLDTGATATLLNEKSFSSAEATEITLESWNGATGASARQVVLRDLTISEHSLFNLKLLAVNLTPLERTCQRRIDGVLGADLIARLGLTIDLKNHLAVLETNTKTAEARFSEFDQQHAACQEALNRSDEKTFEQCLDPDIVLLTSEGDYRGRKAVMKHFKESYFGQDPPALFLLVPHGRRAIDTVIWVEYDMLLTVRGQVMKARGTALYRKSGGRWLLSNMSYSIAEHGKSAL